VVFTGSSQYARTHSRSPTRQPFITRVAGWPRRLFAAS
jgi:hypothetical protein